MKPYGMTHLQHQDDDVAGLVTTARNTRSQGRLKDNSYRSLRGGKKNQARRHIKRQARAEAKAEVQAFK